MFSFDSKYIRRYESSFGFYENANNASKMNDVLSLTIADFLYNITIKFYVTRGRTVVKISVVHSQFDFRCLSLDGFGGKELS